MAIRQGGNAAAVRHPPDKGWPDKGWPDKGWLNKGWLNKGWTVTRFCGSWSGMGARGRRGATSPRGPLQAAPAGTALPPRRTTATKASAVTNISRL